MFGVATPIIPTFPTHTIANRLSELRDRNHFLGICPGTALQGDDLAGYCTAGRRPALSRLAGYCTAGDLGRAGQYCSSAMKERRASGGATAILQFGGYGEKIMGLELGLELKLLCWSWRHP